MNAAVVTRAAMPHIPTPRRPIEDAVEEPVRITSAVAYQRVLHQVFRREFRLLGDLTGWAPADDAARASELTRHADLISRVLLQHHAAERELLWPALARSLPPGRDDAARRAVAEWTARAAQLDSALRDLGTVARQWAVATTAPAHDAFRRACHRVADAVETHTDAEETHLLPLLGRHLADGDWAAVQRSARTSLDGREQMLVLGLALEDACAIDRARLLAGLPRSARTAWRVFGSRNFRAAVVRLRGAPPAA
jgi:hypothetical protein